MTSRIQEQRFSATATKPANGARPTGEIWLNLPDLRIGLIDPAQSAVDLLGVRQYAATSTYALGDYVVHAGDLLRAKTSLTPHAFAVGDWDSLPTQAFNDARYTTQAQNDLRYYTKTQSDANYYNKTFIDTTYYTRIQSDARYYTQAQTDARYLQLTGGALSGELTVGGNGVHYTAAGGSNHAMAFGWDGAEILGWVDGVYIGGLATQTYVNNVAAQYLRLSGGTLTGAFGTDAKRWDEYIDSQKRIAQAASAAGASVILSNHSEYDNAYTKARLVAVKREVGEENPFIVGQQSVQNYFTVMEECATASKLRNGAK